MKKFTLALIALIALLVLAGCGGASPTPAAATQAPAAATTAPTEAAATQAAGATEASTATEAATAAGTEAATPTEAATEVAEPPQQGDNILNVYNWSTYIAPDLVPKFEKMYNVKVNYDLFGSNDELLGKIQAGNPGYDVIVPSDYTVTIMIKNDLLETLDKSQVPNFKNIDPQFLNPPYDPNNDHCVPYQWGTSGLGYNEKKIGHEIDSYSVMFNGQYSGRISWQDEARQTLGSTLIYLGLDPNTTNPDDLKKATDLLLKTKKDVKVFAPDTGQDLLVQGDVDIALEYSGDIFQVAQQDPDIHYVIPKEGAIIWTDNLCIPKFAPHPDLALKFINFILDAQNGADLSNYTQYGTPNAASLPLIDPKLRNNPGIYPSDEVKKHLYFIKSVGDADTLFQDAWNTLGIGQ